MDLGIHLVDLALWPLGFPELEVLASGLAAQGRAMLDAIYAAARPDGA